MSVQNIRPGLALVLLGLVFGIAMGIAFGVCEDSFKDYVKVGIAANSEVHDAKSQDKIWRYAQRAHFHATGISAFSLGLLILLMHSTLSAGRQKAVSILIGLGSFYPMAWLTMYVLAPSVGRQAAHSHVLTEIFTFVGVGGLTIGIVYLSLNLVFGFFTSK